MVAWLLVVSTLMPWDRGLRFRPPPRPGQHAGGPPEPFGLGRRFPVENVLGLGSRL